MPIETPMLVAAWAGSIAAAARVRMAKVFIVVSIRLVFDRCRATAPREHALMPCA
jgi:hypothetical protein